MDTSTWEPESNPYAAPGTGSDIGVLTDFYRTDSRRFSYAEYWRFSGNPLAFLVGVVCKTIRVPLQSKHAVAYPRELTRVAWEDLESHVIAKWEKRLKECAEAGFRSVFCHRLACCGITRDAVSCTLLTDDRLCTAALNYVRVENAGNVKEVASTTLGSRLRDGRRAVTVDYRTYLDPPPDQIVQFIPGKSVSEMLSRHRDWIAGLGEIPIPLNPQELPQRVLKREQELIEHMVARGVFVRLSAHELARVERRGGGATAPAVFNTPLYRFLQGAERILLIVMLLAVVSSWLNLQIAAPMIQGLIQLLLLLGCLAGLALIKIMKFGLRQSSRSVT